VSAPEHAFGILVVTEFHGAQGTGKVALHAGFTAGSALLSTAIAAPAYARLSTAAMCTAGEYRR